MRHRLPPRMPPPAPEKSANSFIHLILHRRRRCRCHFRFHTRSSQIPPAPNIGPERSSQHFVVCLVDPFCSLVSQRVIRPARKAHRPNTPSPALCTAFVARPARLSVTAHAVPPFAAAYAASFLAPSIAGTGGRRTLGCGHPTRGMPCHHGTTCMPPFLRHPVHPLLALYPPSRQQHQEKVPAHSSHLPLLFRVQRDADSVRASVEHATARSL